MFVKSIHNKMSSDPNIDFFSFNWIFQPLLRKRTRRPRTAEYCMLTTAPTSTCVNQFDRDTTRAQYMGLTMLQNRTRNIQEKRNGIYCSTLKLLYVAISQLNSEYANYFPRYWITILPIHHSVHQSLSCRENAKNRNREVARSLSKRRT